MEYISKVQRNDEGEIISFQTSSGRIISYRKALLETKEGLLNGTNIDWNQSGVETLVNEDENDRFFTYYPSIF
ncbi:DUF3892 domain-containing protein [Heyndrickxia sporothermodurans]|uniref:DUF3892 domain-containing protein n=1 Tax=Heyndrickxia sporothermodurans TaxID=46224 RepID=A0A150KSZ1_9BACI|nr:DUF3892 domain-containing protein [Heyndrickxia sporothermodurans]KYD03263.1 hypothetical protein B4102_3426 [Heyndrickxia sporothermodurans]MBL5767057.1 DUF3892 domain-containing protein [Heyndrickxia sporothermodurans]MBL5770498.1 DUF3892 domain-containing protein [Heyndrickxia sporothermodurans]MBL5774187.1 DUF3892 domain-containing protein [Heyndrickxia sporothermodurans]MBL5779504.1 DUF3892 domain-containing protein [Heyndrickxia sporothermodurans]